MAGDNSTSKFPSPYINSIREEDPVVVRVDQNMSEIGTRSVVMPKGFTNSGMTIEHVGGKA